LAPPFSFRLLQPLAEHAERPPKSKENLSKDHAAGGTFLI
jgi:hypothetical protein